MSEALSRIAEKSAIISSQDNGRDLKAVQSLIRKHESFENDLVALEAQLQVLIDDSASLQSRYADLSGPHIAQQQKILLKDWNELQDKVRFNNIEVILKLIFLNCHLSVMQVSERKAVLLSSNDYHAFLGLVRDLLAWSSGLRRSLITEEKVRRTKLYLNL